ncbi:hepaRaN-alpha-glucosaminide n-acetyltransferase [Phtheirospermum japonicum]|uniref:HepaRaN-alpha-glucosaminide n-acetyltransferase n=1 Tax=Phtheirospermum japonicum TaxID=374723 RepID=A0A830CXZ7_9LAMI|nr:hepaRaN-alpha-glucosaminide n-acetyltransferase [Phtheirospermum japonicum]
MASITVVTDTDGERTPLHRDSQPAYSGVLTEYSSPPSAEEPPPENLTVTKQRLISLDVFRGLTVALMILVDDAGKAFPSINHAPWFGVTLADFVMPFFLFGVGVSVSLVFKNVPNKLAATKKVVLRFIKLFLLGIILQGGYFHGRDNLTYGVDITRIRVMGVLQRIAIGYLLASVLEIWLVRNNAVNSAVAFAKRYSFQILACSGAGILLGSLYMVLLHGLYVPSWAFDESGLSMILPTSLGASRKTVHCGLRGSLKPPCNAVGLIDRIVLGEKHLYQCPVYRRTKECSVNSPDYGPLPPNSPVWCLAPFDPEGILSSLMAAITCFVGLHYGHILVHCKVDIKSIRKPSVIFQWMGMNALIVYALAACDIFPAALQGFYWRSPENNLVNLFERLLQSVFHSKKWGTLAFVMLEILFWGAVAGFLHMKRIYIKL